jgi:hypothetical protein
LRDQLSKVINIPYTLTATWDGARKRFLNELEGIIPHIRKPDTVSRAEFTKLEDHYKGAVEEIATLQGELRKKEALFDRIKSCKDAREVEAAILEDSDDAERFLMLTENARKALRRLPSVTQDAVFYRFFGSRMDTDSYDHSDIAEALENGFLTDDGWGEITANADDPLVSDAISEVETLGCYIETELTPEVSDAFSSQYKYAPSIQNKRFWEDVLKTRHLRSLLSD